MKPIDIRVYISKPDYNTPQFGIHVTPLSLVIFQNLKFLLARVNVTELAFAFSLSEIRWAFKTSKCRLKSATAAIKLSLES